MWYFETTLDYLLHFPNFSNKILTFFNKSIDENILGKDGSNISKMLLCGDDSFNDVNDTSILTASIEYIISTNHLEIPLYEKWHLSICLCVVYFLVSPKINLYYSIFLSLVFMVIYLFIYFQNLLAVPLNLRVISHEIRKQQQKKLIFVISHKQTVKKNRLADFWCKNCLFLHAEILEFCL